MFRKIVRKVILKRFWQGIFDANLNPDITRNTKTVFRRIGQKELLFQQERRIVGKPFNERNDVQKKIAELIIARLKCLDIFEPVGIVNIINQKLVFNQRRSSGNN